MKKIIIVLMILSSIILQISCSGNKDKSEIKVGMTYEEIEEIMGKPESITRGANQIRINFPDKPSLENTGTLIYVNWSYNDSIIDTVYYTSQDINYVNDTTYTTITKYSNYIYKNPRGEIVSKEVYDAYKRVYKDETPPPIPVEEGKKIIKVPLINLKMIKKDAERSVMVKKKFCVLFDASSGRVVKSEYFPEILY